MQGYVGIAETLGRPRRASLARSDEVGQAAADPKWCATFME